MKRMLHWLSADVLRPADGQRVVWPAERGNYVAGTYYNGIWFRDPIKTLNETAPVPCVELPSMWRPEVVQ